MFPANRERYRHHTNYLLEPIVAQTVRMVITSKYSAVGMRFELWGCTQGDVGESMYKYILKNKNRSHVSKQTKSVFVISG